MSRTAPTSWRHTTARAQCQAQSDSPKPTNRIKNGDTISPSKPLWEPPLRDIEGRKTVPVANCGSAQRRRHRIRNVVRLQCVMPHRAEPQASENAKCSHRASDKETQLEQPEAANGCRCGFVVVMCPVEIQSLDHTRSGPRWSVPQHGERWSQQKEYDFVGGTPMRATHTRNTKVLTESMKDNRTGRCPKRTTPVTEVQHVVTEAAAQHDNAEVANRPG